MKREIKVMMNVSLQQLIDMNVTAETAGNILNILQTLDPANPLKCWETLKKEILCTHYPSPLPFDVHKFLYYTVYPQWKEIPAPTWIPDAAFINATHIAALMQEKQCKNYPAFHAWSCENVEAFWQSVTDILQIHFTEPYRKVADLSEGIEKPLWLTGSQFNIVDSCFKIKDKTAIIYQHENGDLLQISYDALDKLSNQVANSISQLLSKGDRVAIIMPMNMEAVAIYLGVLKAGMAVASVPESFSLQEMSKRLSIANVKVVFTQDKIIRDNKVHELYEKITQTSVPLRIVLPVDKTQRIQLKNQDQDWQTFLDKRETFQSVICLPTDPINILFSSGTTGEPKAIPWTQTTPLKCASDAYFHFDLSSADVFCWPTSLGWMMGPWLIFACLLNKATIALFDGSPNTRQFGEFIQNAKITHLGVVPTLVNSWRQSAYMENLDWQSIKMFGSTGETSNIEDMLYLMHLVNYKPIIEYCGGTEIAGSFVTGTIVQPCVPGLCSTPTLGLDFVILNDEGKPADYGEVAIIGPSIGLSTTLLNKDHHEVYYAQMPMVQGKTLRRHGDEIKRLPQGYYRMLGRADDTMNLGGIKVSTAEIESVLNVLSAVYETAAVAVEPPEGGPSQLIIYVVLKPSKTVDLSELKIAMQQAIKDQLNPLFKIHEVIKIDALPRTPSNKIVHRELKKRWSSPYPSP